VCAFIKSMTQVLHVQRAGDGNSLLLAALTQETGRKVSIPLSPGKPIRTVTIGACASPFPPSSGFHDIGQNLSCAERIELLE